MKIHLLLVITTLVLSACYSTMKSDIALQPTINDYSLGEKWTWRYRGVTSQGAIRAQGTDTKEIIISNNELAMKTAVTVIPLMAIVKPDVSDTPRYKWPLKVGKKWKFEERWTSEDGTSGMTSQHAEVLSFQEETVEAGTFMAYTIRFDGRITNSRGYSADTQDVHLYAPELKTFIKLTQSQKDYEYVEELIEYINGNVR